VHEHNLGRHCTIRVRPKIRKSITIFGTWPVERPGFGQRGRCAHAADSRDLTRVGGDI